jgi:hypothetical protein
VRTPERNSAWPEMGLMHTAKRFFEWWYLRQLR